MSTLLAWPCPRCKKKPDLLHTPKYRKNCLRCVNPDCDFLRTSGVMPTSLAAVVAWNRVVVLDESRSSGRAT